MLCFGNQATVLSMTLAWFRGDERLLLLYFRKTMCYNYSIFCLFLRITVV